MDGGGTDVGRYGPDCSHVIVGKILYVSHCISTVLTHFQFFSCCHLLGVLVELVTHFILSAL